MNEYRFIVDTSLSSYYAPFFTVLKWLRDNGHSRESAIEWIASYLFVNGDGDVFFISKPNCQKDEYQYEWNKLMIHYVLTGEWIGE